MSGTIAPAGEFAALSNLRGWFPGTNRTLLGTSRIACRFPYVFWVSGEGSQCIPGQDGDNGPSVHPSINPLILAGLVGTQVNHIQRR
jgi:hypothetical protein